MKNKSLVVIVVVAIFLFAGMVFTVYNIANRNDNAFYQAGYVSVTDTEVSNKAYFAANTIYKKGYNNEIVFKNIDNVKEEVSKYSFVYYNDKSISYLTDGVLMALDALDSDYIPYYNIKSNYIISYENGHYMIKTKVKNIILDNFIGRISDTKYVVAGNDLLLKHGGSDELIANYYFELNFVEGNQIKIDNDKLNIKTVSEGSYIKVGNDVKIDLNNQIITYKDTLKMNLSEITINGDSNIDILYDSGKYNEKDDGNSDGKGGGGNTPEQYEPERVVEYKNVPYVELLSSNVSSTRIRLEYKVIDKNKLINGDVVARYLNLANNEVKTISCSSYDTSCVLDAQNLTSNNRYLVTISTSYTRDGILHNDFIMFQRTFVTSKFNIGVEQEYISSKGITYRVKLNENSAFDSAKLNLYNNKGELVATKEFTNTHQDMILSFDELRSNSTYTARIEDVVINNVVFKDTAFASSMVKTLKYNPLKDTVFLNTPLATANKRDYTFKFDLQMNEDVDGAIKGVTYDIYDKDTNELVKSITKEDALPFSFDVTEEFDSNKVYVYQATLKINDNEKLIYQKTLKSNDFSLSSKVIPSSTFVKGEITANTLEGQFKIYDVDNAVDLNQTVYVEYTDQNGIKSAPVMLHYTGCGENESATTKCVDVHLSDLSSDNTYTINLYTYVDLKDDPESDNYVAPGMMQTGIIQVTTTVADIIYTDWTLNEIPIDELQDKVFDIDLGFSIDTNTTSELVIDEMSGFDMLLYEGAESNEVLLKTIHIGCGTTNIKEEYFNAKKNITLATFGYSLNDLISRHLVDGSQISQRYTIRLLNGKSGIDYVDFRRSSYTFDIDQRLLDLTTDSATIQVKLITNDAAATYDLYDDGIDGDTIRAVEIIPFFENKVYVKSINYTIYDVTSDVLDSYSFKHNGLSLTRDSEIPTEILPVNNGNSEEFLKRGHTYLFTYTLDLDLNSDGFTDVVFPITTEMMEPNPVKSDDIDIPKQAPKFLMIPWTSTEHSIFYKYDIVDVDKALEPYTPLRYRVGTTGDYEANMSAVCPDISNLNAEYYYDFNCAELTNLNDKDVYTPYFSGYLLNRSTALRNQFAVSDFVFESILSNSEMQNKVVFHANDDDHSNLLVMELDDATSNSAYINRISNIDVTIKYGSNVGEKIVISNINDGSSYLPGTNFGFSSVNIINPSPTTNDDKAKLRNVAYVNYCSDYSSRLCIFLDYSKLYYSSKFGSIIKDLINNEKRITVSLDYWYDTGKVGYFADTRSKYAFQVKSTEPVSYSSLEINNYYLMLNSNYATSGVHYSPRAMSSYYAYNATNGGFVADSGGIELENHGRTGKIFFRNYAFNDPYDGNNYQHMESDYYLGPKGVMLNLNGLEVPILAKELSKVEGVLTTNSDITFKPVVPALDVRYSSPIINGLVTQIQVSGYEADESEAFVYLEVYSKDNNLVQTIKLKQSELIHQASDSTHKISGGKFVLNKYVGSGFADYRFDVSSVTLNGVKTTNYIYDNTNGVITITGDDATDADSKSIDVSYSTVIYGLNIDTDYYYKAYININSQKKYLIDSTTNLNDIAVKPFKTLDIDNPAIAVNNIMTTIDSLEDYTARYLDINFILGNDQSSEYLGFDDFVYEIYYGDDLVTLDSSQVFNCTNRLNNYYANVGNACIFRDSANYYVNHSYIDITNGKLTIEEEPFKFVFGTDYKVVVKGKIKTSTGYIYQEMFNGLVPVKPLDKPTITVSKKSYYASDASGGKNALRFIVEFQDNDRVLSEFTYSEGSLDNQNIDIQKGKYLAYLAKGTRRTRDSELASYTVDRNVIVYTNGILPEDINGLESGKDYYLIIRYTTDTNEIKTEELRFPIYTLDDGNVALGKVFYFASNDGEKGISELTFSYATNIMDYNDLPVYDEENRPDIEEEQEAYVAGMIYSISIFGGDKIVDNSRVFFVRGNENFVPINYVENTNASSELGENYYQIILEHDPYPTGSSGANYIIDFQLYLSGKVAESLNTEEKCIYDDGVRNKNYWGVYTDKNGVVSHRCFILSDVSHEYSAQFKVNQQEGGA